MQEQNNNDIFPQSEQQINPVSAFQGTPSSVTGLIQPYDQISSSDSATPKYGAATNSAPSIWSVLPTPAPSDSEFSFPISRKVGQQKKRYILLGAIIGVVILVGAVGLGIWLNMKAVTAVTLYQVNAQTVTQDIGGGGIVFPFQQLNISYPVPERVVSLLVQTGDQVSPNQPLIKLDPSQLNAQIQQASDDLAAAQSYLTSVSTNGNALALAQAQHQYDLAKSRYNALIAQAASPLLQHSAIISPMSGTVVAVNVNPGEVFAADTTLITIMDEAKIIVHVQVPLINLQQVHLGQQAVVTPSALPNLNVTGTVSAIIPQADPQTDTFEVWIEVTNTDKNLLPGMSAFVRIQQSAHALVVPRLAVLNSDHNPVVFVVRNGHVYLQPIQVVGRSVDRIFVSKGISSGSQVVLIGISILQNGQAVRVREIEGQSPTK